MKTINLYIRWFNIKFRAFFTNPQKLNAQERYLDNEFLKRLFPYVLLPIVITTVLFTCYSFYLPVNNNVPLAKNQTIFWHKKDIGKKHFVNKFNKGELLKIELINLNKHSLNLILDTVFSVPTNYKVPVTNIIDTTFDTYFINIKTNNACYYKIIETE